MAVRNYFSGVEGDQHFNAAIKANAKHVLMSYLYLTKRGPTTLRDRKKKHPDVKFMIDSGAHTFEKNWNVPPYNTWKVADYEKYLVGYVEFLKKNAPYISCAVELDIDWPLVVAIYGNYKGLHTKEDGRQIVESWQEKYFKPLTANYGIEIIYVWHEVYQMTGFESFCQRFPYVGIPGEKSSESNFNQYITIARRYTTKLHGFAATKQSDFRDWPWFSVDSTTWKSSERYGTLIDWDAHTQRLVFEDDKSKRADYREKFIANGFNADAIIRDTDYTEVTRYALFSMAAMEDFYKNKYKNRTFYYELRLPPPTRFKRGMVRDRKIERYWQKYKAESIFKSHAEKNPSLAEKREFLMAISAVQYRDLSFLAPATKGIQFLAVYFPTLIDPNLGIKDLDALQKELAVYTSPRNEQALPRTSPEHWIPTNNPPRQREKVLFSLADLEFDDSAYMSLVSLDEN
jgi:hypothetical protein